MPLDLYADVGPRSKWIGDREFRWEARERLGIGPMRAYVPKPGGDLSVDDLNSWLVEEKAGKFLSLCEEWQDTMTDYLESARALRASSDTVGGARRWAKELRDKTTRLSTLRARIKAPLVEASS